MTNLHHLSDALAWINAHVVAYGLMAGFLAEKARVYSKTHQYGEARECALFAVLHALLAVVAAFEHG
ncbi:hypothetical protein [Sphingomonas sp. ERG5]|uniref:hypothetical protein n=1 Tax=Sphingomonas sp. ERG5 TaxID=1381597 RepID=UPI00054B2C03|nr:hypothetical protein [Sphingomonas sp. ERG5]